jgi:uncharacterized protein (TIGR00369 family)
VSGLKDRLREYAKGNRPPPPIVATLGMRLLNFGEGKATLSMSVGPKFHNPMGTLHGGIITDLADAAMGIATVSTLSEGESFTTLELKMNFLRPVRTGRITAEGVIVHRGGTIVLAEVVVTNDDDKTIARGMATQIIVKDGAGSHQQRSKRKTAPAGGRKRTAPEQSGSPHFVDKP